MQLRFDDELVESAVFLCARRPRPGVTAPLLARFHRERERCYGILDPDLRQDAFARVHLDWFREWRLEELLTSPLHEFPRLPKALAVLAFRQSKRPQDEGAELYVNESDQRHGVLAMRAGWLDNESGLAFFLHHELSHLDDMVNPDFGYVPDLPLTQTRGAQDRLARERYRLLWDITIDGRLTRRGRAPAGCRAAHRAALTRAFAFWAESRQTEVFESLWTHPAPRHDRLAALAVDPRDLGRAALLPTPGAPCPLCGFPTFAWADRAGFTEALLAVIQAEFPDWALSHGACAHCLEIYQEQA
jgi:hypothetical protein